MRLRRFIVSAVCFTFFFALCAGVALALEEFSAGGVTLSNIRINPPSLPGPGTVAVAVHVKVADNRSEGGLANVRVEGQGVVSETVAEIPIGGESELGFTLQVAESQLGSTLHLALKWDGAADGLPFTVSVPSSAPPEPSSAPPEPKVSFTRTIDKTTFLKGDSVSLIYKIENTGSVDITGITVTDDGIPGMTLTKSAVSASGSAALNYTFTPDASFTSAPKLTYTARGKNYSAVCDSVTVTMRSLELQAVLEAAPAEVPEGGEVALLCTLTNSGTVRLTGVTIGEISLGSKLFPPVTLDKGTSRQFSRKVALAKTATFQYEITAKDEFGNPVTFKSNALEVKVTPSGAFNLEIAAVPDALQLSQPGRVNFNIIVRNNGDDAVADAVVKDQNGNVVSSYALLPAGESRLTYFKEIDATTQFNFSLSAPAGDGSTYEVSSGPVEVVLAGPAPTPTALAAQTPAASVTPQATPVASSGRMGSLMTALLIVGFLIVVTVVILVVMVVTDRRKRAFTKR